MAGTDSEIRGMLNLGAKIARKMGTPTCSFINGQMYQGAKVVEIDGFTFKTYGRETEITFNKDPFVSRSGKKIIRFHYSRYNAPILIPEIAKKVGVK